MENGKDVIVVEQYRAQKIHLSACPYKFKGM